MTDFASLLQQGNAWLFVPSAILLGALHGLEPGHSKTMMAAFIVAIRGTLKQAVLLGLAATLSHTAVVWLVAMARSPCGWRGEPGKRASRTIIIITTMITTTMTMTTIMIITTTTTNTRWLKKSGRTPTSALTRRILTGASAVKTSPPARS